MPLERFGFRAPCPTCPAAKPPRAEITTATLRGNQAPALLRGEGAPPADLAAYARAHAAGDVAGAQALLRKYGAGGEWNPSPEELAAMQAEAHAQDVANMVPGAVALGAVAREVPYDPAQPFRVQAGKLVAQPGMPPCLINQVWAANQPGGVKLMAIDAMGEAERARLAWPRGVGARPAPGRPHAHHWAQAKLYGTTYCKVCGLTIEQWGPPAPQRGIAWVPGTVWWRHPFFACEEAT